MNLGEFLSPEAGQRRRAWLEAQAQRPFDALRDVLGGTGVPERVEAAVTLADYLNPVSDIGRAGQSAKTVFDPNATTNERVGATGAMLTDMASVLAPAAAVRLAGGDATRGVVDALANAAMPADDALTRFAASEAGNAKLPYGIEHRPMTVEGGAASLDDLTRAFGEDIYGREALQYFGSGDPRERSILRTLQGLRGKPDAEVTIYRGVPDGVEDKINPGDWVTLDPRAAADYGNVVSMKVPARDVTSWADSLMEFGYYPSSPADPATARGQEVLDMLASGRASEVTDDMLDLGDSVQNARLNQYLFNNYDLPMDEASRMARAREMGFDAEAPVYHGSLNDINGFRTDQKKTDHGWYGDGVYFGDADTASIYAMNSPTTHRPEGGNVIQAATRGNIYEWPEGRPAALDADDAARISEAMQRDGYAGANVYAPNDYDTWGDQAGSFRERVIFNPANIRSRFARFDPRLAHLRNLSASVGGVAMLGDYLSDEAELRAYLGM